MTTFFMFGKYSTEGVSEISQERTARAIEIIEDSGGAVTAMYAVLGQHDLILIVELPELKDAMAVSIELNRLTGLSFITTPAVEVEAFDKMVTS